MSTFAKTVTTTPMASDAPKVIPTACQPQDMAAMTVRYFERAVVYFSIPTACQPQDMAAMIVRLKASINNQLAELSSMFVEKMWEVDFVASTARSNAQCTCVRIRCHG